MSEQRSVTSRIPTKNPFRSNMTVTPSNLFGEDVKEGSQIGGEVKDSDFETVKRVVKIPSIP